MAKYQLKNSSQNRVFGYDALGNLVNSSPGAKAGSGVACNIQQFGGLVTLDFTFTAMAITLVKNGTSTAGGGTKIFDFNAGYFMPVGGSVNATLSGVNATYAVGIGTVVADTGGTLATTEQNLIPTANVVVSTTGAIVNASTVSVPTPNTPIDGHSSAVDVYFNAAINADGTGKEALTVTGTARYVGYLLGDN
jgi:hypothetical protein